MKEKEICAMLKDLGIFPNYKGYKYLLQLTQLVLSGETEVGFLTKSGYPRLAKQYQVTPMSVERACRTVIASAYALHPKSYFNKLQIRSRPTNSKLIFALADAVCEQ